MLCLWMAATGGIAGGMTRGVRYLETVVGSSVPPGIAARARDTRNCDGSQSAAPVKAPVLMNSRLVSIAVPSLLAPRWARRVPDHLRRYRIPLAAWLVGCASKRS